MRDLTILLTLKDRENYTERWLEHNVFPEFSYFVADGSLTDRNEEIFRKVSKSNITYQRFQPDSTYPIYILKRLKALKKIKTKFVLFADNDDFLLRKGLNQILDFLDQNPKISLVQGNVGMILEEKINEFTKFPDWEHYLGNRSGYENIKYCLSKYFSLFYSISETKIQKKIFELFAESGTQSPYLVEEFQTYFSIIMSKTKVLPDYYYVRLANPTGSQNQGFSDKHRYDLCLDQNFHKSFYFLVHKLAGYIKEVDEKTIAADLREYQISKIRPKNLRLRQYILEVLRLKLAAIFHSTKARLKRKTVPISEISSLFQT